MSDKITPRGSDLIFDPVLHRYSMPDGRVVPSVTQNLRATGVSTDFEALPNREAIALKRDIGTALHADAHAYDDNDLDERTVHPDVRPYLEAWKTFRANMALTQTDRERILFHRPLWFCGTTDGVFTLDVKKGFTIRVMVDLKTGDPESAAARYQLAGYQLAWEEEHPGLFIHERWSVQLTPGTAVPYRIGVYDDWQDQDVFKSIVTTYYARPSRHRELS